jgi:hypothetical protein
MKPLTEASPGAVTIRRLATEVPGSGLWIYPPHCTSHGRPARGEFLVRVVAGELRTPQDIDDYIAELVAARLKFSTREAA